MKAKVFLTIGLVLILMGSVFADREIIGASNDLPSAEQIAGAHKLISEELGETLNSAETRQRWFEGVIEECRIKCHEFSYTLTFEDPIVLDSDIDGYVVYLNIRMMGKDQKGNSAIVTEERKIGVMIRRSSGIVINARILDTSGLKVFIGTITTN